MRFSIYRYNPETDKEPSMKDYELEIPEGSDMMLLEALILLKDKDSSLTFRRSCREGVCGSDDRGGAGQWVRRRVHRAARTAAGTVVACADREPLLMWPTART